MERPTVYAEPRLVTDLKECYFYHTMDVPGHGTIHGEQWDLRKGLDEYLGGVDVNGKRVLEVGTANGMVCFEMERRGADVVAYDLSKDFDWDIVPFAQYDHSKMIANRRQHIHEINNGFWYCHRLNHSKAKVVYGKVYDIPDEIGKVDIATYCQVLLHLRDPFLALQKGLKLTRETVIVSEVIRGWNVPTREQSPEPFLKRLVPRTVLAFAARAGLRTAGANGPYVQFMPDPEAVAPKETWWYFSPQALSRMIAVLGFEDQTLTYHRQSNTRYGNEIPHFTIVGRRTRDM